MQIGETPTDKRFDICGSEMVGLEGLKVAFLELEEGSLGVEDIEKGEFAFFERELCTLVGIFRSGEGSVADGDGFVVGVGKFGIGVAEEPF